MSWIFFAASPYHCDLQPVYNTEPRPSRADPGAQDKRSHGTQRLLTARTHETAEFRRQAP